LRHETAVRRRFTPRTRQPIRDRLKTIRVPLERMLAESYRLRGWDAKGAPTKARLKALRLL
jgi:aldehyde:ferredoxin oxidoreductase